MKTVWVMPGEGRRVRLENGAILDARTTAPVEVARTIYIERRLQCGDLVAQPEAKPDAKPAPVSISSTASEAAKIDTPPAPASKTEPVKAA